MREVLRPAVSDIHSVLPDCRNSHYMGGLISVLPDNLKLVAQMTVKP
jgi:hypothetical protein